MHQPIDFPESPCLVQYGRFAREHQRSARTLAESAERMTSAWWRAVAASMARTYRCKPCPQPVRKALPVFAPARFSVCGPSPVPDYAVTPPPPAPVPVRRERRSRLTLGDLFDRVADGRLTIPEARALLYREELVTA